MNSRIVLFFQYIYKYFQVSLYFWIYLLKGLFIYSLVPVLCALFLVLYDINKGEDEEKNQSIKTLFKEHYDRYKMYKLPSFIYSFALIVLYSSLYFINKQANELTLILSIVLIYFIALTLMLLTHSTAIMVFKKVNNRLANIHAFLSIFKNPVGTIAVLAVFIILYLTAGYNFALFLVFGPFLYGLGVIYSLYKLLELE